MEVEVAPVNGLHAFVPEFDGGHQPVVVDGIQMGHGNFLDSPVAAHRALPAAMGWVAVGMSSGPVSARLQESQPAIELGDTGALGLRVSPGSLGPGKDCTTTVGCPVSRYRVPAATHQGPRVYDLPV